MNLWIHPAHRKNGLGHQLMEAAHDYGCQIATVATISFQGDKTRYVFYRHIMLGFYAFYRHIK